MAYYGLGVYHRAIEVLRQVMASIERERIRGGFSLAELASVNCRSYYWLALSLADVGAFVEAIACGEEGVRMAEARDRPNSLISALQAVGLVYVRKGDLHQAIPVLERGMGLCQVANIPNLFPPLGASLGFAYALSGRVAEALPLLERAVEETVSRGRTATLPQWTARLGEAYLLAGRLENALQAAHRALELADTHKERGSRARALRFLGEIHAYRDPLDVGPAEAYYRQALALAEALGMRPLQAHCHRGLGTLYGRIGRVEQARTELTAAIELYRAMDMTFWLPQTEAALAQVEGR
jgi:tetratricopeptide (TPR) repeat protein